MYVYPYAIYIRIDLLKWRPELHKQFDVNGKIEQIEWYPPQGEYMYHIYTIEANDFIWHMKICVENKSKPKKKQTHKFD